MTHALHPFDFNNFVEEIATQHGVSVERLMSRSRKRDVVQARWEVFERLSERRWSLPQISRRWGMHHTSVLHGLRMRARQRGDATTY